jgi:DNA-binding CsgD family transcriptional regulator
MAMLLRREDELQLIERWLDDAREGLGRVALIRAGAGLGKTSILREAGGLARERSLTVLAGRGRELEREMAFGVARQLFEPAITALDDEGRASVADGAARVALPAVTTAAGATGGDASGVIHGLYWLAAALAEREPLLALVDDAHWSDEQTLRWLAYLAPRVSSLPLLVLIAARPVEPGAEQSLVRVLGDNEEVPVVGLQALDSGAVAELARRQLAVPPAAEFGDALARASGGNPFFVSELLRMTAEEGIAPDIAGATAIAGLAPEQVTHSIQRRVERAGERAIRTAQAIAVLGGDALVRRVAALVNLSVEETLDEVGTLVAAEILRDVSPLDFIHPIVRTAVYDRLPRGTRSRLHHRAADVLHDEGAPAERVGLHALATAPAGASRTVERLRAAAVAARAAGAPDSAARFLRRALEEPPVPALRAEVALELGQALIGVDYAAAAASFDVAADTPDRAVRVAALRWRAQTLGFTGYPGEAVVALDEAIAMVDDEDQRLLLESSRDFYALGWHADPDWRGRSAAIQSRADGLEGSTPGERRALSVAAFDIARTGAVPASRSIELADRVRAALATWLDTEPGIETPAGIGASSIIAEDAEALARHEQVAVSTRRIGMTVPTVGAHAQLADIHLRRGELLEAESDGRLAWNLIADAEKIAPAFRWWALSAFLAALTARGELAEANGLVLSTGIAETPLTQLCTLACTPIAPVVVGELELALGRVEQGIERLTRDGAWLEDHGWPNPSLNPWRARAAPALAIAGRIDDARDVVAPAVERARRFGAPWALGMALRAAGMVEQDVDLLGEAVAVLEVSSCRMEYAHALIELGAALRRRNSRAAAREYLRHALDVATRAGAVLLAARAREELAASGARARRELLSGVESLTASERRVANLAAAGHSNPQIAQALFVTRKTVEAHLRSVYLKLNVAGRGELATALKD